MATVANRPKVAVPPDPRSRGLLCRELLNFELARAAADHAQRELSSGRYAGATYLVADAQEAFVIVGGSVAGGNGVRIVELEPGLHLLSNGCLDDLGDERQEFVRRLLTLQRLDSSVAFLAVASRTFSRQPDSSGRRGVVVAGDEFGTVSSTLLALTERSHHSIYQYAAGPPSGHPYDDLSAMLRQVLSADR